MKKRCWYTLCYPQSCRVNGFHWNCIELKLKVYILEKLLIWYHLYFILNKMNRVCKNRSSYWSYSIEKGENRCFSKFRKSHKKMRVLDSSLLKTRLRYRCFPVNFAFFLKTPVLQNTSVWLLRLEWVLIARYFFNYGENSSTLPTQIERGTTQKGYITIMLNKKRSKRRINFTFSEICW